MDDSTTSPEPQDDPGTEQDQGAEQLGDAGKQAIDRMKNERNEERKARRAIEAELAKYKQLAEQAESAKLSDIERANKAATDAAARADQLAAQVARFKVIAETQLPKELHEFLPEGVADEAVLMERAEKLRSALGKPPAGPRPDPGQGPRPPSPQSEDDALYESIYGPSAQK